MKTDRFADIIRRKLESIRPEFTDKDWARMQATLKDANLSQPNTPDSTNPFSGGVWSSGKSWLLAAASVSTIVLVAFSMWQQRELNELRQTVGQLRKQPANQSTALSPTPNVVGKSRSDVAHSDATAPIQEAASPPNRNEGQAVRPDTVYITQYVPVPSREKPGVRTDTDERLGKQSETSPERDAVENAKLSSVTTRQPATLTKTPQTESHDISSTPSVAKKTYTESVTTNKSANSVSRDKRPVDYPASERSKKKGDTFLPNPNNGENNVAANQPVKDRSVPSDKKTTAPKEDAPVETLTATNKTPVNYEPVASLPLAMESKNWSAVLAQRAKRMRPTRPVVTIEPTAQAPAVAEKAPSSQPVQQMAARFRVGVGGEVASRLWSAGVFTEVLLGRHWSLGIGLSQATYLNNFITEYDFNDRTHRDFRKEFARPGDIWRDILSIDTRQVRLQIPVSLGYRIPLNQSLTLLPTAGTYLSLTNSDNVTYYCRDRPPMQPQTQRGFDEISTSRSQPVDLINNLAFGVGIEWQRGHWVAQASPVLTLPFQTNQPTKPTDLNWQQNTTVGLRARFLYQF